MLPLTLRTKKVDKQYRNVRYDFIFSDHKNSHNKSEENKKWISAAIQKIEKSEISHRRLGNVQRNATSSQSSYL